MFECCKVACPISDSLLAFNMRSKHEATELSYESFMETYGSLNSSSAAAKARNTLEDVIPERNSPKIGTTGASGVYKAQSGHAEDLRNNNRHQTVEKKLSVGGYSVSSSNESNSEHIREAKSPNLFPKKRRLRKISMERLSSIGGAVQAVVTPRRTKILTISEPAAEPKMERRTSSFLSNIPPYFARKLASDSGANSAADANDSSGRFSVKNPKPAVYPLPASRLTACAHKGLLDCRNKKKQWERYWCVLQDSCLYCYHSPQSEITCDAVLLRGYDVVADVTNLSRSRFVFRLQQQGVPTLHFSSDNHRDFLLWVGTLEKETQSVNTSSMTKTRSNSEESCISERQLKTPPVKQHRASMPDIRPNSTPKQRQSLKRTFSQEKLDQELIKMQKHKLLKEIAVNQQQIIEEQKLLDRIENSSGEDQSVRKISREQILDHYERDKIQEELRTTKFLTLLNCRRNSAHLKMVQYTKDLEPKNGQLRRENHAQFSAMEKKLKDMQEAVAQIDREVEEEEATKQHNLEKLQRKRDLELLIVEQRDAIDLLRQKSKGMGQYFRRHSSHDIMMTPSSIRSHDALTSIDEQSNTSEDHETASTTSSLTDINGSPSRRNYGEYKNQRMRRHSDATVLGTSAVCQEFCRDKLLSDGGISSDGDSGFQPSTSQEEDDNSPSSKTSKELSCPPRTKVADDHEHSFRSNSSLDDKCRRESTLKSKATQSHSNDIDSSILAKIEDFELFAKLKLEETRKS